jgi:hypothetical protein
MDQIKTTERISKMEKELKMSEEKNQQYENQLRNKQFEINNGSNLKEGL